MSDEDVEPAEPDDVWATDLEDPWPDDVDDPDDADDGPGDGGGGRSKGRLVVGLSLLVIGLIVALIAFQGRGDDDEGASSRPKGKLVSSSLPESTTTAAPTTIVPTTLAGGQLPTGCGNWDPAFSFDPDPIEGVTIYSDFDGWHIRLASDGPEVVTGTVVGQTTPLVSTEPPGPGVQLIADPATATVTYRLTAGDDTVGFDFAADCSQKQLTFDLKDGDGKPLDPAVIHLGRTGGTTALPVVAQRQQPPPG